MTVAEITPYGMAAPDPWRSGHVHQSGLWTPQAPEAPDDAHMYLAYGGGGGALKQWLPKYVSWAYQPMYEIPWSQKRESRERRAATLEKWPVQEDWPDGHEPADLPYEVEYAKPFIERLYAAMDEDYEDDEW